MIKTIKAIACRFPRLSRYPLTLRWARRSCRFLVILGLTYKIAVANSLLTFAQDPWITLVVLVLLIRTFVRDEAAKKTLALG